MSQLAQNLVQLGVSLLVHYGLRQFEFDLGERGLQDLIANLGSLLRLLGLLHLGLGGFAQFIHGVELGSHLSELIVHSRQLALLGLLDVNLDGGLFVLVLARLDGGSELVILTGLHTTQGGVQALDEVIVTDAVGQALGGSVLDLLAVNLSGDVDDCVVAGLHLALGVLELTEALCQLLQRLVDVLFVSLQGRDGNGDLGEVWNLKLRADINLGGEFHEVFILNLGNINVRLADNLQIVFLDCLLVTGRQHVIDDLLQDGAAAEASVNKLARCLALTETWNRNLLRDCRVSLIDFLVQLRKRNVDGELNAGIAQLVYGGLHE